MYTAGPLLSGHIHSVFSVLFPRDPAVRYLFLFHLFFFQLFLLDLITWIFIFITRSFWRRLAVWNVELLFFPSLGLFLYFLVWNNLNSFVILWLPRWWALCQNGLFKWHHMFLIISCYASWKLMLHPLSFHMCTPISWFAFLPKVGFFFFFGAGY